METTPKGTPYLSVILAINKDKDNTTFLPIMMWKRTAEVVAQHKSKGDMLGIEGTIEVDQYDKDGQRKYYTYVLARRVYFA